MSELHELPDGWEWREISQLVFEINSGFACSKKFEDTQGHIHLRTHNISTNGKINLKLIIRIANEKIEVKKSTINKGDILFNNTNSVELVGKTALVEEDADFAYSNHITRIKVSELVEAPFLVYYLQLLHIQKYFERICKRWIGQAGVNNSLLKKISIPLPLLQEQKRIVAKLDTLFEKIDKAIALHQKNMDESDVFMGSVLNEVFGELEERYGFYKLDEICSFSQGIQVPTKEQLEEYKDGLYKFVRIINYTQLSDEYRYVKKYSEKAFVNDDDIVMVRYGATAGFIGKGQKGLIANNLFRVMPHKNYINDFIYYGIKNPKNQSTMYNNIGAAAMPAVNFGTMSLLTIPNISVSIQQKTVKYLDQISEKTEKLKSVQKEKMESLKALKASILDKAFRGEI